MFQGEFFVFFIKIVAYYIPICYSILEFFVFWEKIKLTDFLSKNADRLKSKKLWLFDMDGTIYNENTLFCGTLKLLSKIRKSGGRYVFITNNSSKSTEEYISKINDFGIEADRDNFFTSVDATINLLKEKFADALVYCQGTKAMIKQLTDAGISVTEKVEDGISLVLTGYDTELTSAKLRNTCEVLLRDVEYYATNPDLVCPVSFGYVPDCGSVSIMLENATGKKPIYIGKPQPTMVHSVMKKFSVSRDDTVIIGDRLYTDIATGVNAGVDTVCVLSGESTLSDIENSTVKPTFVFENVKILFEKLKEN